MEKQNFISFFKGLLFVIKKAKIDPGLILARFFWGRKITLGTCLYVFPIFSPHRNRIDF